MSSNLRLLIAFFVCFQKASTLDIWEWAMLSPLFCIATITFRNSHSQHDFSIMSCSKCPFIVLPSVFLMSQNFIHVDFPLSSSSMRNVLAFSCYVRKLSLLMFYFFSLQPPVILKLSISDQVGLISFLGDAFAFSSLAAWTHPLPWYFPGSVPAASGTSCSAPLCQRHRGPGSEPRSLEACFWLLSRPAVYFWGYVFNTKKEIKI